MALSRDLKDPRFYVNTASFLSTEQKWQARRDSNPQPSDLESDALAVRATGLCLCLFVLNMLSAMSAKLLQSKLFCRILLVLRSRIVLILAARTL